MSDTRALLLTDVVDSTQIAEQLGDAAAAELGAAHDRVARDLLRQWHGREIDKTDGMLMLFERAADAVACALAYHRALAALPVPLRARAGLHVGAVTLRANPPEDVAHGAKPLEVEGLAKPVAARVMSLALGGQTLLTREAREALGACAWRVQSHGHWRVKGVAEPVELFEVGDEGAPFEPPPDSAKVYRVVRSDGLWLPRRELRHGLPAERDAFVGRRDVLDALARRYDAGARLVSLLGIGGVGKTRLAQHFGWAWLGDFPGGAWFCDLSQARGPDGIVHAVAQGLDVPLGKDDPVQQLGHAIAGRGTCLVILDNFEQVARHAADTLGRWLDRAADARFLVTSREVLGLPGEEALPLAPLGPQEAQALFERRAAAAGAGFGPSPDDAAAIPPLVKLLDGLPLAIELAAARVRVMPPRTLLARMDQRFKLLATQGGRHDRQATLRATFDWSWELLNEAERSTLAQLSVFEGGFTLEAVEAVVDLPTNEGAQAEIAVTLYSLIDKSFVQRVESQRCALLVSVQEYAADRLAAMGDSAAAAARSRHWHHFAGLQGRAGEGVDLRVEIANLALACRRAASHPDPSTAADILDAIWSAQRWRGPFQLCADLAVQVLGAAELQAAERSRAHYVAGCALAALGLVEDAGNHLEAALMDARTVADPRIEAAALLASGELAIHNGLCDVADEHYGAALNISRRIGAASIECGALNGLGTSKSDRGQFGPARAFFEAALRCARACGDQRWQALIQGNLGALSFDEGAMAAALADFSDCLRASRELGDYKFEGNMLCNIGALHQLQQQPQEACRVLGQALSLARSIGHLRLECIVRCNLGLATTDLELWQEAREHLQAGLQIAIGFHDLRSEGMILGYQGRLEAQLGHFDAGRSLLDAGAERLERVADHYSLGLIHCHRAELESLAGCTEDAERALVLAGSIGDQVGVGDNSEFGLCLARADRLAGQRGRMQAGNGAEAVRTDS